MNCQQNSSSTSQCNRRNNENLIYIPIISLYFIICIYIQVLYRTNNTYRQHKKNNHKKKRKKISCFFYNFIILYV